jgi:hypothetical protein
VNRYAPGMIKPETEFRTSSYCGGGACVEVKLGPDDVTVRATGVRLALPFTHAEWREFVAGVKAGEFDV